MDKTEKPPIGHETKTEGGEGDAARQNEHSSCKSDQPRSDRFAAVAAEGRTEFRRDADGNLVVVAPTETPAAGDRACEEKKQVAYCEICECEHGPVVTGGHADFTWSDPRR